MSSNKKIRRVAVLGARAVGKSSLCIRFCDKIFENKYYPTIENGMTKSIKIKDQEYQIDIIDTAGQDEFSILSSLLVTEAQGYVFVYSITSKTSWDMISIIRDKILNQTGLEGVPCVIVGNKIDLGSQRVVSREEVQHQSDVWHCPFVETSAKDDTNVEVVFQSLVKQIDRTNDPPEDNSAGCSLM